MKILMRLLFLIILLNSLNANSQKLREMFIDTTDNAVDASKWLSTVTGFVPLVIPITEPAVGYGAGAGLVFFHPNEYRAAAKAGKLDTTLYEKISPTPPSLTGAGGFYTQNKSWAGGIGHLAIWKKDRIRYNIGAGLGSINLDYYGMGLFPEKTRRFNMKVAGLTNEIQFRLGESNWWAGLAYKFGILNIESEKLFPWPDEDFNKKDTRNAGLLPAILYDNRDNIFTPNRGFKAYAQFGIHDSWLGGSEQYQSLNTYLFAYQPWSIGHVTGLRFDAQSVFGDPTFVYKPYVVMRGIPVMKYQDKNTALMEVEQRAKIYKRWSLVAFAGLAKAYPSISEFMETDLIYSYGTGFRYYLAKKFGMHMGMDFAWGPEDFAFYITLGSGWFRL